jgi:hypothetical protein
MLNLIEMDLFPLNHERRAKVSDVYNRLDALYHRCEIDIEYCTKSTSSEAGVK